jgi:hypothetical protein
MKRVLMLVEGQTEETFVRELLAPHLWAYEVAPTSVLAATKVVKSGARFKGGLVSYGKVRGQILRLLSDRDAVVTTMFDLNGLPADFPGCATRPKARCYARVAHLENAFGRDINDHRFRPYLQLHEFEAFMLVDPRTTALFFPGVPVADRLAHIRDAFNSPEEINEEPASAPSRRILAVCGSYEKPLHGPLVVIELGLQPTRDACSHFNEWLTWLESLG